MDEPESKSGGAFGSVRRIADSVHAILLHRLELAAIELQEERVRIIDLLLQAAVVLVLGTVALLAVTATGVVLLVKVGHLSPLVALSLVTVAYALATALAWWNLRERLKNDPQPFADTLAEFKKDREWFQGKQ